MMETSVGKFFERYESFFNQSLAGHVDMDEVVPLYASEFIATSPAGVMTGRNDDRLKQVMAQGYARYRAMGTKEMPYAISASPPWMTIIALPMLRGRQPMPARISRA